MRQTLSILLIVFGLLVSCTDPRLGSKGGQRTDTNLGIPQTAATIKSESQLIGGPSAQGRIGDVLLANDSVRFIIQKPGKSAGIGSFGGTIIDADHRRSAGQPGKDQWGELFPLVNVEWTVNVTDYRLIEDPRFPGAQILRTTGLIDVYDFLDLDWIADAASVALGQQLSFDDRFDDRRDPFKVAKELQGLSFEVITDIILKPGTNYLQIETTFSNNSDNTISMPIGDFLVGGGFLQTLIPGLGFSPSKINQASQSTPAVLYTAFSGGDVSYGYFFQPFETMTTSVSEKGLTGVLLGEEFLKILPVGTNTPPEVHFEIAPKSRRTVTRYFVVGKGDGGSLLDTGLGILKAETARVTGWVTLAGGASAAEAVIAIKKKGGGTVANYATDASGKFTGLLPTGRDEVGKKFGDGHYEVWVEKKGYHENGTVRAGSCDPSGIDISNGADIEVHCALGETGLLELIGGVIDAETGLSAPARMTVVGEDPSPETRGVGTFVDLGIFQQPFGIVDIMLVNAMGNFDLGNENYFEIEPGNYRLVFSRGPEYAIEERFVKVDPGGVTQVENVSLRRVVKTPGFVSADFHIHANPSPDSAASVENRALTAVAMGLDVLQSSDHDFLTDYGPVVKRLVASGILSDDSVQTVVGDEITPNHYGHLQAFPLIPDFDRPDHGALDWSAHPLDQISPAPDYCMSPREIAEAAMKDPGEEVIQINHIMDGPTGLLSGSGWLTTPMYKEIYGVDAFVSYADPIERRLEVPTSRAPMPPYGMSESELIFDLFTAVELTVGPHLSKNELWGSAFPVWFNLLNLGLKPTGTASSDSHHEDQVPLGLPRNYVAVSHDPKDQPATRYDAIDEEEYARNINAGKVVVSAGPFIQIAASNESGNQAGLGETISGKEITLDIQVDSPDWAWFDTIEIYANTEPIPTDDTGTAEMTDEAASPEKFAAPYHVQYYRYQPVESFSLQKETLPNWKLAKGKISATVQTRLLVTEDAWVVVVARGTKGTEGYRSLFPVVPMAVAEGKEPEAFDPADLTAFHRDEAVTASAWAFTNPIYIDTDGDSDSDGNLFEAKWVREGHSKLKPFRQ